MNNGLLTAYFPMVEVAQIKRGQTVVLTAGSSSTAMAALQVAKRLGLRTIATTRTRAKFRTLIDAGFDHVVVADEQKVPEHILRATEGAGADLVYDAVAGPGLEDLANATKVMGHLVVCGALGAMTAATPLPLWALFRRTVRMYAGYKVFDFMGNRNMGIPRNQPAAERALKFLLEGLESGAFTAPDRQGLRRARSIRRRASLSRVQRPVGEDRHHDALIRTAHHHFLRGAPLKGVRSRMEQAQCPKEQRTS